MLNWILISWATSPPENAFSLFLFHSLSLSLFLSFSLSHSLSRSNCFSPSFFDVTWLIHMCDMNRWYGLRESFMCVAWIVHMCDSDSFMWGERGNVRHRCSIFWVCCSVLQRSALQHVAACRSVLQCVECVAVYVGGERKYEALATGLKPSSLRLRSLASLQAPRCQAWIHHAHYCTRSKIASPQVEAMQARHGPVCLKRLLSRTDES